MLFLICVVLAVFLLSTLFQAIQTLNRLDVVESERDKWQRPSDIVQQVNLRDGSVAVDLGSGSGYFALKLARAVGNHGSILAVDIRRLPLLFLQTRAFLRGQHNIRVIRGDPDNPHLSADSVDAVLVADTYHELTQSQRVLRCLLRSLRHGGRLVIVDRGPGFRIGESRQIEMYHHEVSSAFVEADLRQNGFEIIKRQDDFIAPPDDEKWWLIVARRP